MNEIRPTILAFASAHGGTGQTALAAHVALGLSLSGKSVVLVEMCKRSVAAPYLPSGATQHPPATPVGLGSLTSHTRFVEGNLWHMTLDARKAEIREALTDLANRSASGDFWLILDLLPHLSLEDDLQLSADLEFQVLRADPSSLVDLERLTACPEIRVIINQIDARRRLSRDIDRVLSNLLGDRVAARVHYDEALPEALAHRTNVFAAAPASRAAHSLSSLVEDVLARDVSAKPIYASRTGD